MSKRMMTDFEAAMRSAKAKALNAALSSCKSVSIKELCELIRDHGLESITLGDALLGIAADRKAAASAEPRRLKSVRGAEMKELSPGDISRRRYRQRPPSRGDSSESEHEVDGQPLDDSANFHTQPLCTEPVRISGRSQEESRGGVADNRSYDIDEFDREILRFLEADGGRRFLEDVRSAVGGDLDRVRVGVNRLIESGYVDYEGKIIPKFFAVRASRDPMTNVCS